MNTRLLLISLLTCLCGCTRVQTTKKTATQIIINSDIKSCKEVIINDSIIYNLLPVKTFVNDTAEIRRIFKVDPKIISQSHKGIDGYVYETLEYKSNETELAFLKNDGGYYLTDGIITDSNVLLYKNCSIGIERNAFLTRLSLNNIKCDTIQICNQDQTYTYLFVFNKDKLQKITIESED